MSDREQTRANDGRCVRCSSELEPEDLRCPLCGLGAPSGAPRHGSGRAEILRCSECAAAVSYVAEARAPKCAFCDSVMKLEQPADPVEQAEAFVPFAVPPEVAGEALRRYLRSLGFFRPSDLATRATVAALRPLFWASWVVNARALVSWTADSNAGAMRAQWAPHAGQTPLDFANLVIPATRGLSAEEAFALSAGYDLAGVRAQPSGPPDAVVERVDVQRSAARRAIGSAIEATSGARVRGGAIPGSRFRNVNVAVLLNGLTTRRLGLPAYVLAYRYGRKLYRAVVHGQNPAIVLGDAPYSAARIALVVLGSVALIALVLLAIFLGGHLG